MTQISLRADCARCAALCCVALAFDRSTLFAIDKPAGEPCPNLTACGTCRIHGSRAARGFGGCKSYDCHGAGQRVTQDLFGGRAWLQDASLLRPMSEAFLILLRAHRLLLLLREAEKLALCRADQARRAALERRLEAAGALPSAVAGLEAEVRAFLRRLGARLGGLRPAERGAGRGGCCQGTIGRRAGRRA